MRNTFLFLCLFCQLPLFGQTPELVVPIGHTDDVIAAAFSPDGEYVVTCSSDQAFNLWDRAGNLLRRFAGHDGGVFAAAFSPDGQHILTGGGDNTARLWDLAGKELQTFTGHTGALFSLAFSSGGDTIVTASDDGTAILWNRQGDELRVLADAAFFKCRSVALSPDGRYLAVGGNSTARAVSIIDGSEIAPAGSFVRLWDLESGQVQRLGRHQQWVLAVDFSPDGQKLLSAGRDSLLIVWNLAGERLSSFKPPNMFINSARFSPDSKQVLVGGLGVYLLDLESQKARVFSGEHQGKATDYSVTFGPGGRQILAGCSFSMAHLWDLDGTLVQTFRGYSSEVNAAAFSPDGTKILSGSAAPTLWDLQTSSVETLAGHGAGITSVQFSGDGQTLITGSRDRTARIWDPNGRELATFAGDTSWLSAVGISDNGQVLLTACEDGSAQLRKWDGTVLQTIRLEDLRTKNTYAKNNIYAAALAPDGQRFLVADWENDQVILFSRTGQRLAEIPIKGDYNAVDAMAFAPDGATFALAERKGKVHIYGLDGRKVRSIDVDSKWVSAVAYSANGEQLLVGTREGNLFLFDVKGKEQLRIPAHRNSIRTVAFSPDGQHLLTGGKDHVIKLWNRTGAEVASLLALDNGDWVVTAPYGLFDASPGAMRRMHYTQGLEVIALEQLKERYYEPGLLSKLMGYNREPIRDVSAVDRQLELYPEVALTLQDDRLDVRLTARGGGIGRVALYIDNKEVVDDLDPSRSQTIQVDLNAYEKYFQPGQAAQVGVQAWDRSGSLASQVQTTAYTVAAQPTDNTSTPATQPAAAGGAVGQRIRLFALCIGSGDYAGGTTLDLSYAEQDARQMAQALELAGAALFLAAPPDVRLLTTCKDCPDPASAEYPSKANIERALADIAQQAGPQDVVVLYLSGHGLTYADYWYYLTHEMSSSVLTDQVVREQRAISSRELKEWMAAIPARKQVIMIDACASGQLNQDFDLLAQKDVPSSQIRALNRLGSRGGLYVISASTADQVSYEASPFGMGLLTYGLLQGMQGASLRESEFVDVDRLFAYAEDQVPKFADYINKTQKPMVYAPQGSESFDIGRVTSTVKQGIQLAEPKKIFSQAYFRNGAKRGIQDNLQLSAAVNTALRDYNYRGVKSPLIFVETDQLPQAYFITGDYTVAEDGSLVLEAVVVKEEEEIGDVIRLTGETGDLAALSTQLIKEAAMRVK